ncbi:hypothetical protein SERLADRAFT_472693 [Serpula lacrymans var. lacrymans S7.9]|uniref:DUF6533 domain-containing protein n=1 Tax=Serpula lacrymans var. lacrymans (strain S7.9) TaxID=578457 RepID=F8P3U9_SERL9|nr:uncharacterized protein SERLADRAFT_472693 [Serpula lacrymans var. lacrymans S7.9]EGO22198.1 hypothetical protein SERLADRAFT_472693 [Serpula lacrymans var. lacrymans S7.9]
MGLMSRPLEPSLSVLDTMSSTELELTILGIFDARYLTFACYSLVIYDHALTLDQEIGYFWNRSWSVSQFLFFLVRYLTLCTIIIDLTTIFLSGSNPTVCSDLFLSSYGLFVTILIIVQVVLTLRVWYLFSGRRTIQLLAAGCFCVSFIATIPLVIRLSTEIRMTLVMLPGMSGCIFAPSNDRLWAAYLPVLFIHSVLYIFLVYRVLSCRVTISRAPILKRFLREGGLAYLVTTVTILYSVVGSTLMNDPTMFIPVSYPSLVLATSAVSTTRLMLSIRSLASDLHVNAVWLLNHAELARLNWKRGPNEGELIVEVNDLGHFELPSMHKSPLERPDSVLALV